MGVTQAPLTNALVEEHEHLPVDGKFRVNELLQAEHDPLLLQAEQFDEQFRHVFVPSLYFIEGQIV